MKKIENQKKIKIYTHNEAANIVELFENILCCHGIKLSSPEDDERDAENDAALFGSVYSNLVDDVELVIAALVEEVKENADNIEIIEGIFE